MQHQLALDTAIARAVAARSARTVRVSVGSVIAGVGIAFAAVLTARMLQGFPSLISVLFGGIFPFVLATGVTVGGVLVFGSQLDARQSAHIGLWWTVGTVVAGTTGVGILLFEANSGVALSDPTVVLAGSAATGGLGGMVVGWFDARRLAIAAEREREREQLADEREKLALVNRIVRHDIGNNLQIISGMADALERHVEPEGADALERLQRTTGEAIDLTERVRTFVSTLGEDTQDLRPIDVGRVVDTQVGNLRERHTEATVTVENPISDVEVEADELLATVLHNLLSNAIAHNDAPDPHVRVSVEAENETVRLRVADNGPGVPDERKETLFDRGERDSDSEGTGIGLYIVDVLVERYGGTVRVEDRDGASGAVFVVELPRVSHGSDV